MEMASRQQQQQPRVVENHVSRPVHIDASSRYREEEPLNRHYSIIGLRTWGQNYYETVVKNTIAGSSKMNERTTPSPQKKPIDLRLSIPEDRNSVRDVIDDIGADPADVCTTPLGAEIEKTDGQSLPSTVSKHLNGMFDDIMKEVFREDTHDTGDISREEEGFRIAACPSPTRDVESFRQPMIEAGRKEDVVLNMQDMSPLLDRMREIDRARNGNIALPVSAQPSDVVDEAVDLEMQQDAAPARKQVPSLVHFYDSYNGQKKQRAPGKPPLPTTHGAVTSFARLSTILGPQYSKKVEQMMHKNVLPLVQKNVLPLMHRITHGKRMIFAMIALAYLVAIHVYIITSKL